MTGLEFASVWIIAACLIGAVHTAVERALHRHTARALDEPYQQPSHVRIVRGDQQS